jgi:hypothetical protein
MTLRRSLRSLSPAKAQPGKVRAAGAAGRARARRDPGPARRRPAGSLPGAAAAAAAALSDGGSQLLTETTAAAAASTGPRLQQT